jgi:hypothetical protein
MRFYFILFSLASSVAYADVGSIPKISFQEMSALAITSIEEEVVHFNTLLEESSPPVDHTERKLHRVIRTFRKDGIYKIDPEYLIDKCVYQSQDIDNFLSPTLTLSDDETTAKKNRLAEVSALYGLKFYKAIYYLCNGAKIRFAQKLKTLRFKNSDFKLSPRDQEAIVELSFLPTIQGKQNFLDQLNQREIGVAILLVGAATGAVVGLALPGVLLSVVYLADESHSLIESMKRIKATVYRVDSPYSLASSTLEME